MLAFCGDDATMEFYAPPEGFKVEDLCFEEHGDAVDKDHPCCGDSTPHIHAHVRADGECCPDEIVSLRKQDAPPKLRDEDLLPPNILGSRNLLVHGQLRRECGHEHTADCGHTAIQHGDHVDYLVRMLDGSVEVHHPAVIDGVSTCIVHGMLRPNVIVHGVLRPANSVPAPGWQRYKGVGDSSWDRDENDCLVPAKCGQLEVHHPISNDGAPTVVIRDALNSAQHDEDNNGAPGPADEVSIETPARTRFGGAPANRLQPYLFRRPNASERNVFLILVEVYDPKTIAVKLFPTAAMRLGKTLALVFNEGAGRLLCGWRQGESKLLDAVGQHTAALCEVVYKEEITEPLVHDFLRRRFLFCLLTAIATAIQIILHLVFQAPGFAAMITLLLAPITLIDRQFATLVTKNTPRYERSQMLRMINALYSALRGDRGQPGPFPDLQPPPRYKMYKYPIFNLTHLEMVCGATQFLCGLIVFFYMALLLPAFRNEKTGENDVIGRYFDLGDDQCDRLGRLLCYPPTVLVTVLRCVKELTNFLSPWIEWQLTPIKYSNNSNYFQDNVESILDHANSVRGNKTNGAIDSIKDALDPAGSHTAARSAVGAAVEQFLVDDGKARSCCTSDKDPVGCKGDTESGSNGNKLPPYVRRCNLTPRAVDLLSVLYECAGRTPPFPAFSTSFIPSARRLWRVSSEGALQLAPSVVFTASPTKTPDQNAPPSWTPATGGPIHFGEQTYRP